jgi:prepilin-type N-terminal cleavage/methylation domain-containing protein
VRRPEKQQEQGFTLIEVTIAAAITVIASMALFSFLEGTTNITQRVGKNVTKEEDVQLALRSMTSDLRSSSAVEACATVDFAKCVTVAIPRASGTGAVACPARRMTYALTAGTITQTRVNYSSACTTTTVTNAKPLLTGVTSTGAIFLYYDDNGVAISPTATSSGVYLVTTTAVSSVSVALKVSQGNNGGSELIMASNAALRNNR